MTDVRILDPLKPSNEIGFIPKSGLIVYDTNYDLRGEVIPRFFMFKVGGGGDLFIRGIDGEVIPYLGMADSQVMVGEGDIVYNSVTVGENTYTTTCTNICVYGGQ